MKPIISIVTPTRNRPELLERSIGSVQSQALEAWEMIVVDDGDGTGILRSWLRRARWRDDRIGRQWLRGESIEPALYFRFGKLVRLRRGRWPG